MLKYLTFAIWNPSERKTPFFPPRNQSKSLAAKVKMQYPQLSIRKARDAKGYCWAELPVLVSPVCSLWRYWKWLWFPALCWAVRKKRICRNGPILMIPPLVSPEEPGAFEQCCLRTLQSVSQRYRSSQTTPWVTAQARVFEKINPQSKHIG